MDILQQNQKQCSKKEKADKFQYRKMFIHSDSKYKEQNQESSSQEIVVDYTDFISCSSIKFCKQCRTILTPYIGDGSQLLVFCYQCKLKKADMKTKPKKDSLMYTRQKHTIWSKKKTQSCLHFALDPLMPRMQVPCPQCQFPYAIYYLTSDANQTRLVPKLVCGNVKNGIIICGNIWELNLDYYIYDCHIRKTKVMIKTEEGTKIEEQVDMMNIKLEQEEKSIDLDPPIRRNPIVQQISSSSQDQGSYEESL